MPEPEETIIGVSPGGFSNLIERASFHLLSIAIADERILELYEQYDLSHIETWFEELKETETIRLLLEIATMYRMEEWNTPAIARDKNYHKKTSGIIYINEDFDNQLDLSVMEACNKIIHAKTIFFNTKKIKGESRSNIGETVCVKGTRGKQAWEAYIDLVMFCNGVN